MAADFTIDRTQLDNALARSPEATNRGAATALGDIKRDWVRASRDIAPLDSSNLRRQIESEVFEPGANGYIETRANAENIGHFNYGYYIHEMDAGGRNLLTMGTEKKFLDVSAEDSIVEWARWLEEEVQRELNALGW